MKLEGSNLAQIQTQKEHLFLTDPFPIGAGTRAATDVQNSM